MAMAISMVHAQNALKRVYNETIDPMTQIDDALVKAKLPTNTLCAKWAATGARGVCALPILLRRILWLTRR